MIRKRGSTEYGTLKWFVTDSGTEYGHRDCLSRLEAAVRGSHRWFARAVETLSEWNDQDMRADEVERLRWVLDDMAEYVEAARQELVSIEDANRKVERIKALREVTGRTPEEAALYLQKAAELEAEKR